MSDATISLAADQKFIEAITGRPGGEHLLLCFACGTCTLACPVAEVTEDYNPRRFIRKILMGRKEEILSDPALWYCHQCFRCAVHCPQDVSFTTIVRILQAIALEEGYVTREFVDALRTADREAEALRMRLFCELSARRKDTEMPAPEALLKKACQL